MSQTIPLVSQKNNPNATDQVKNGKSDNKNKTGVKNGDFTAKMEDAEKTQSLTGDGKKGKTGTVSILRLISEVVRNITQKLPHPLQKKLFTFVKDIIRNNRFSEKEKGDLLSGVLKKLKKHNGMRPGEVDDLQALLASLNRREQDGKHKDSIMTALLDRLKEADIDSIKKKQKDEGPKLVVIDLRKRKEHVVESPGQRQENQHHQSQDGGSEVKSVKSMDNPGSNLSYFSMNDHTTDREQKFTASIVQETPRGFDQEMLRKLKSSLDNEMVKQTKLIIKQGGNGEIRIVLKPESLGQIRMRLYLDNNHIDGRIFVENNTIRGIVEQSMESLQTALKQGGYDSVALHVSVGQGNGREDQGKPYDYIPYTEAVEEFEKNGDMVIEPDMHYARVNLYI